jgi:hypothetical protein
MGVLTPARHAGWMRMAVAAAPSSATSPELRGFSCFRPRRFWPGHALYLSDGRW